MDAFRLLDRSAAVHAFDVIEHRFWRTGSYLRLQVLLTDGSRLHTREYVDEAVRKYAYHWHGVDGELIARWDNAPHHPEVPTHPDHKHTSAGVEATDEVALRDVLGVIEDAVMHP